MAPQCHAIFPGLSVAQHLDCCAYTPLAWRKRRKRRDMVFDIFPPLRKLEHALVGHLSGGERRMVRVGRALKADARLYVLDEPSLGLAPKISASVIEALLSGRVDPVIGMHAGRLRGDVGHVSPH